MNRRDSIKAFVVGTISASVIAEGCETPDKKPTPPVTEMEAPKATRMPEEQEWEDKIKNQKFFTDTEMASIVILVDIIIPKDEKSGSATDAKVPEFIDFMALDKPDYQTPLRGGLRWLELAALKSFDKSFKDCSPEQRITLVDRIAYPNKVSHGDEPGVAFFSMLRNLTVTGFFTSKMGIEDLGYVGNRPNQWNGVPDDVLKQYNMSYSERELKESAKYP